MSREKGLIFQKGFLLQKGPSHSPLTSTTDSSHLKPDRCAGGYRQESSLCVVLLFFVCVALETWRCRAKPLFFLCCVFIVTVAGVRVQCGCWQNALCMLRWAGGGGHAGNRKEEVSVTQRSGQRWKWRICCDQADGWTVRYVFLFFLMEPCYSWLTWYQPAGQTSQKCSNGACRILPGSSHLSTSKTCFVHPAAGHEADIFPTEVYTNVGKVTLSLSLTVPVV